MNNITSKQKEDFFIDRLAAQRNLYTCCKWLNGIHFIISAVAVVTLTLLKLFANLTEEWLNWIALYSIIVAVVAPLLVKFLRNRQLMAARIQQWFDTELFGLPWNDALCGNIPDAGLVHRHMKGQDRNKLDDWYVPDSIKELSLENGILVCMRENVYYDKRLRETFRCLCMSLAIICLATIVWIALANEQSTWDLVLKEVLPLLPLYNWWLSVHKQNNDSIALVQKVDSIIMNLVQKSKVGQAPMNSELSQLQDFIFNHRRSCYVIPDTLYTIMRKCLEEETAYDINELINELK